MIATKHFHQAACPLCHTQTDSVLATKLRRGTGIVFYCPACAHGFLAENQAPDAKAYYAEGYRQEYSHNAEAAATNAREIFDIYKDYQQDRLLEIVPHLSPATELLEVGASSGQFLVNIKDRVARVDAIELDKACCAFLSNEIGVEADSEFLRESKLSDRTYDVICSFQVLEHVEDPVVFLRELRQSAKKGATMFIEVPNLNDPLMSVWSVEAYQKFFYHSAHLHYFTETSLIKTAMLAGFAAEQVAVKFTQDYNLLNHLNWITNNAPQATCHVGLSEVAVTGANQEMSAWLSERMRALNEEYVARLVKAKATSNMMMVIKNV